MELGVVLSAMRRNKLGALLIALQIAMTLAILCNCLFIIKQRIDRTARPSGMDEANIFAIDNQWVGEPNDISARLQTDLMALRSLPGVIDAFATNSYPFSGGGSTEGVSRSHDQEHSAVPAALYFADEHGIRTLGLRLSAGRNFKATEVSDRRSGTVSAPTAVIITRELAARLFPKGDALGRSIYAESQRNWAPIVGIVDQLPVPWVSSPERRAKLYSGSSMLEPFRPALPYAFYMVRVEPGRIDVVMRAARAKLIQVNRTRVLQRIQPLTVARAEAYKNDRGIASILGSVCAALLTVTSLGVVGLTSYWVTQRRRQIGIRRALGASRSAIVRYFQIENLVMAIIGVGLGVVLAIALNLWMVSRFEMERLQLSYPLVGAVIVLVMAQLATVWPALRAAAIPPAVAARPM